ncbi:MAG: ABC transporter substrate-binding protein [Halobacteriaceae archaeon]
MGKRIMSRRRLLQGIGAAGVAGLAGCAGTGGGPSDVTLGIIQPLSGSLSYYGQQALWGFYSGLAYKGDTDPVSEAATGSFTTEVDGTEYRMLVRDTQLSQDTAQTLATDLVQNEDVDMLIGPTSSAAANRVIDTVAKPENVPIMIGPAASAGITSNQASCGENVFRASENTAMDARSGGRYVAEQGDVTSVYLFGADYSFGQAVVNNYETVLREQGVEIAGKRFVESGTSEWEGLLDNAEQSGADGMVAGFTVSTLPAIFTTYLQGDYSFQVFGGFATRITNNIIGGVLQNTIEGELTREKLQQSGLGPFTTRYHWNQYDNEINNSFVETYTNAYGTVPDLFTSGLFTAASAIVQGVQQSGSSAGADIAAELRGMTVTDTPKGENAYTFQEYNNQARSAMTVADVVPTQSEYSETWGAPVQPSEPVATIPADQTTIPQDAEGMNCSL